MRPSVEWALIFAVILHLQRQELERKIALLTGNTVTCGLFTGLILPDEQSWGDDRGSKILGLYEKELEPALKDVVRSEPDVVMNIGCAEGFYALGLARLIPNAKVIAYDIDERAQKICKHGRQLNNLNGAFEIRGYCSAEELQNLTQISKRPFALIDCEGGERELLLSRNYDFANTSMIVECHDFLDRSITSRSYKQIFEDTFDRINRARRKKSVHVRNHERMG